MKCITSILFLLMLLAACKKNKPEAQSFLTCAPNPMDSAAVIQQLIGKWRLSKLRSNSTEQITKVEADLTVVFKEDGTYQLFDGTDILSGGNTILMRVEDISWGLHTTNQLFLGIIEMCDNQLAFENSYEESRDTLFERVN